MRYRISALVPVASGFGLVCTLLLSLLIMMLKIYMLFEIKYYSIQFNDIYRARRLLASSLTILKRMKLQCHDYITVYVQVCHL